MTDAVPEIALRLRRALWRLARTPALQRFPVRYRRRIVRVLVEGASVLEEHAFPRWILAALVGGWLPLGAILVERREERRASPSVLAVGPPSGGVAAAA